MADLKDSILKYTLENAVKFKGKANPGAIVGKLLKDNPSLKDSMKDTSKQIQATVKEVNDMKPEEQEKKLLELEPDYFKEQKEKKEQRKEERKELPELKNVKGKVVMRFEPSPSGPMHIGHAYTGSLNYLYVKRHGGKLILRISDTNADNIYPKAYNLLEIDGKKLWGDVDFEVQTQSDSIENYYKYAKLALEKGVAYVCTCDSEAFKKLKIKMQECSCRNNPKDEQLKRWDNMLSPEGFKEGEAVVRFKTDIKHKNPAMRDFPILRINETNHPKQGSKYRVWPLMNWSVTIDDMTSGMTHILRGKDHMDNAEKQKAIFEAFGKPVPETLYVGMINFMGLPLSATKVRQEIEEGKYSGWEDIRLPFITPLLRRGYQKESFFKFAEEVGTTQNDKTMHGSDYFKLLNAFNTEIIESKANRYFMIKNPEKIIVKDAPEQIIELDLHPDLRKKGRKFKTSQEFLIEKDDMRELKKSELYRLMDCLNFRKEKDAFVFDSLEYDSYKARGKRIMHWLTTENNIDVEILMPDNKAIKGIAEQGVKNLKKNDIIQFERFGFCRLDAIEENRLVFWFAHN